MLFVIWSNKHSMWWAPNREGYARTLREAGLYSEADARDIEAKSKFDPAPNKDSVAMTLDDARDRESVGRTRAGSVGAMLDAGTL